MVHAMVRDLEHGVRMSNQLWYALQVRARCEKVVASTLASKGYEGYLPLYSQRNRWSDRIKEIQLPLFAGYLFCRFDVNKRLPILVTPGVMRVVGIGGTPYPVEEHEIQALQAITLSQLQAEPWSYLNIGQKVRIELGSLAGVEGILAGVKGSSKLVVSVSLLKRSVAVEIDESWVVPVRSYANASEAANPLSQPNLVEV
jgi:transcription termination/antitermination protein NusG